MSHHHHLLPHQVRYAALDALCTEGVCRWLLHSGSPPISIREAAEAAKERRRQAELRKEAKDLEKHGAALPP